MSIYFSPVYDWQIAAWQKLTASFPNCAHAQLIAGSKGTGKLEFALRFAAWVLCQHKQAEHACGTCQSCSWLKSDTHPHMLHIQVAKDSKSQTIKVDDIRTILPFTQQSSSGARVVIIQDADLMNLSAANALLKTLEEPAVNVYLLLTTSNPQKLLPTIKSRVQQISAAHVEKNDALNFLSQAGVTDAASVLAIAGGAPLLAKDITLEPWYSQRATWLKVWQALRAGQRSHLAASQFWQKQLSAGDVLTLNELMCRDMLAIVEGLPTLQADVVFELLYPTPSVDAIIELQVLGAKLKAQLSQNIGTGFVFDELTLALSLC